ncbi:MAG: hypothetical protein IH867_01860 [Chloroflexi bacterium]|nr:hypothetical protein [Chloroflexota bacterium]
MPESDHPSFFRRRPLCSAVLVGAVVLFFGGFFGFGIIAGPVVAGFLYFRNMPLDETKSIWLTGAKAGVLVSLIPGVPLLIFFIATIAYEVDSAAILLFWVTLVLIVWMILNAGLGGLGAWLKNWHSRRVRDREQ